MTKPTRAAAIAACLALAPCLAASPAFGQPGRPTVGERTLPVRLGLPPRPERGVEERAAYVRQLRDWYQRDPAQWPAPTLDPGVSHRELGALPPMRYPPGNPPDRAKEALGRQLFFDPRLSGSGQIACASCHDPDLGWSDGRTTSFGHNRRKLARNAPSILNGGYRGALFWDGRAASLEEQAVAVLSNVDEMHSGDRVVVDHLADVPEYVESFRRVFGVERPGLDEVALALAAFERTVVSGRTRFDAFVGGRRTALADDELAGLHLFRTDARCLNCHSGPLFTDDAYHAMGLSLYGRRFEDLGRHKVTARPEDAGAFRTPSLRDVTRTSPYMHNGLFELQEVLRLYNAGMPVERPQAGNPAPTPRKSPRLRPLGLNAQDLEDLAAFLGSLEESRRRFTAPKLPPGL